MKKKFFLIGIILFSINISAQEITSTEKIGLKSAFIMDWIYFKMYKDPTLPYEKTHNKYGQWLTPYDVLLPGNYFTNKFSPILKISRWSIGSNRRGYLKFNSMFYLIEKENGLPSIKTNWITDQVLDSMNVYVNDSIFPYDNRFLAFKVGDSYKFCSGNITWVPWNEMPVVCDLDVLGYIRGVQFGVDNVHIYDGKYSEQIRNYRPEYTNYEYVQADRSFFNPGRLLIAAPKRKSEDYIEYIFFTNDGDKTGDYNTEHHYEMRYILPTNIESIKERRMEKRLLSDDEVEKFLRDDKSPLRYFWDIQALKQQEKPMEEIIIRRK